MNLKTGLFLILLVGGVAFSSHMRADQLNDPVNAARSFYNTHSDFRGCHEDRFQADADKRGSCLISVSGNPLVATNRFI